MCVFVSRPMKVVTFLRKNGYHPKRVVDFLRARDTFRNKIMEAVEDFDEKSCSNNNGRPWKSLRILRVKPNFFIFHCSSFFFFSFFRFFFIFSFFLFLFFFFFISSFFIFLHFLLFSFLFLFLSCISFKYVLLLASESEFNF